MLTEPRVVPNWDEYFVTMADLVSKKSKDRSTQCGSVIVGGGTYSSLDGIQWVSKGRE